MNEYNFTIHGNQEDTKGNPIPYFRQTQRSSRFNKNAIRYHHWKDYVRNTINEQTGLQLSQFTLLKVPTKAYMVMKIYFKSKVHADPDNIFKGIADSIFHNDKYVAGSFDFEYSENPRVEVILKIF